MTERIKAATILKLAVAWGLVVGLMVGMIVCGVPVKMLAQQPTGKSLTSPGTPPATTDKTADKAAESKRRQQAYLRFIEAQRLKGGVLAMAVRDCCSRHRVEYASQFREGGNVVARAGFRQQPGTAWRRCCCQPYRNTEPTHALDQRLDQRSGWHGRYLYGAGV